MKYDFTSVPDRSNTGSSKWDGVGADASCVPLSVADMEFYTAPPIREALSGLVNHNILGYTHETDEYYDAVISWQKRRHNFDVKKEWILTTPGVVNALAVLVDAATKPAESVLILTPVYYPFDMAVIAKTRHVVYSTLINNDGHYEIDFADVEEKCKRSDVTALMFCNPHNPVGRVWTREELEKIGNICCDNGVFIIDDEIHNDLIMPGYTHTVMAAVNDRIKDQIAVCTAPSKTFNLAGLQCSNIIIPNAKMKAKAFACCLINMQMGLNIASYTACRAAYNECEPWLDELLTVVDGNAKYVTAFMAENFPEIKVIPLEGTYLLWVDMRGLGMTHVELNKMLRDAKVYVDNGDMFGPAGRGFERFNLACARTTLEGAMERFKTAVSEVREKWAAEGKPVHSELTVGETLELPDDLSISLKKKTMLVFARPYDSLCTAILEQLKKAFPLLKLAGLDMKVILPDDAAVVKEHAAEWPFDLIADPDVKLFDRYNIFEANSTVALVAGDKMFEDMCGTDVKTLLDTDLVTSLAETVAPDTSKPRKRDNQLSAVAIVDKDKKILYRYYSKTISDFPSAGELLKGRKS